MRKHFEYFSRLGNIGNEFVFTLRETIAYCVKSYINIDAIYIHCFVFQLVTSQLSLSLKVHRKRTYCSAFASWLTLLF